jgi:Tfp pilus assembly protein PilF
MSDSLSLTEARKILDQYSCTETKSPASSEETAQLQSALLCITQESEWENLGVCADNLEQGLQALASYLKVMGYTPNFDPATNTVDDSPVYIKFNTSKMSYFTDSYTGNYRGVLVSCQSEEDAVAGTYGHLPLDLFG